MLFKFSPVIASVFAALYCASSSLAATSDFDAPFLQGGFQLASPGDGYGQPLNIIISAKSDPRVLQEGGFLYWAYSIGLRQDCLSQNNTMNFTANLGDGRGWQNQSLEVAGPCFASFAGGNHLRVFPQASGALFIAAVNEDANFSPVSNGYDLARDQIVNLAINGSTLQGVSFNVSSEPVAGLLNSGVLMNNTVVLDHNISTDGIVKVLTIDANTS